MRSSEVSLNNGMSIPMIGMGTYSFENHREATVNAVLKALKMGYNHFDTAQVYGSEAALGNALEIAITDGIAEREGLFVTTKLWGCYHHDPVTALKQSLMTLGMEYVDMYLVHWPVRLKPWATHPLPEDDEFEQLDMETTWAGMERCLDMGLCRGIGVSYFSCKKIEGILDHASVTPAVNQVEMHPMWRQKKLREYCKDHKIHVSAYSALGVPGSFWGSTAIIDSPAIQLISHKHGATPAQIALRWGQSKGASVIVKSFNEDRMRENMGAFEIELEDNVVVAIEKMEERKIMRGEFYVNKRTSPYKTIQDLWDDEI